MNRSMEMQTKLVGVATVGTLLLGACTAESNRLNLQAVHATQAPADACEGDNASHASGTKVSLAARKCLNLVLLPTKGAVPRVDTDQTAFDEQGNYFASIQSNPEKVEKSIKAAFLKATYNRYQPTDVKVQTAKEPLNVNGCLRWGNKEDEASVKVAALPYAIKGAMNIIVLDAENCIENDTPKLGGFAYKGGLTMALKSSLDEGFPQTVVHEEGHYNGLDHGGVASCLSPEALIECTIDTVANTESIMSYAQTETTTEPDELGAYAPEELYQLGLLEKHEYIKNPAPGTYALYPISNKQGAKLIITESEPGKNVYVSLGDTTPNVCADIESIEPSKVNTIESYEYGDDGEMYPCYEKSKNTNPVIHVAMDSRENDSLQSANIGEAGSLARVDSRLSTTVDKTKIAIKSPWVDGYATGELVYKNVVTRQMYLVGSLAKNQAEIIVQ